MGRIPALLPLVALALLALSCASANELTRRAEVALRAHDYERAYRESRSALDKEPGNGRAILAMSAAAHPLIEQRKQRVANLAAIDTVTAADQVLELEIFRAEVLRYGAPLPEDARFDARARALKTGAASRRYRDGRAHEREQRWRHAYRAYAAARRYDAGFGDLDARMPRVYEKALVRVAVLPFENDVDVPGLSRDLAEHMGTQIASRVSGPEFEFTRIVDPARVDAALDARGGPPTRERAAALGRAAGAQLVIWGRYRGLRTETDSDRYRGALYRRTTHRDSSGRTVERWVETPFASVQRRRDVWARWEFAAVETKAGEALLRDEDEVHLAAATFWTDFEPTEALDRYALYPPDWKRSDAERCRGLDAEWREAFGRWTVPQLLEQSREGRERRSRRDPRREFARAGADRPIFMNELPATDDLAYVALSGVWENVVQGLRRLEQE